MSNTEVNPDSVNSNSDNLDVIHTETKNPSSVNSNPIDPNSIDPNSTHSQSVDPNSVEQSSAQSESSVQSDAEQQNLTGHNFVESQVDSNVELIVESPIVRSNAEPNNSELDNLELSHSGLNLLESNSPITNFSTLNSSNTNLSNSNSSDLDQQDLNLGLPEAVWDRIKVAIPPERPKPKGGRPRMGDRKAMDAIAHVLRTGIQWKALPKSMGASSTVHDRYKEWLQQGVLAQMWELGLGEYAQQVGFVWQWNAVDQVLVRTSSVKPSTDHTVNE